MNVVKRTRHGSFLLPPMPLFAFWLSAGALVYAVALIWNGCAVEEKCFDQEDCGGLACKENGRCGPCIDDAECDGKICVAGRCEPRECEGNDDCEAPQICDHGRCTFECVTDDDCLEGLFCVDNRCRTKPCMTDANCPEGFVCVDGICQPGEGPIECPADMARVLNLFCIDVYEASRPDATADNAGSDESMATSRADVLPWMVYEVNSDADAACQAAGKRLCTIEEWEYVCHGPQSTVYAYGDDYEPQTCNGLETFGPADFHLMPTGSFPGCTNELGVFDMNGNLWEHIAGGDGTMVRGGAYNCSDSREFHRCDYVPTFWTPSALGFRCCWSPE